MARPTKYNEDIARKIANHLRQGATRTAAYGSVGIDQKTFLSWLERFSIFSIMIAQAEADAELLFSERIRQEALAPEGDWRAAEAWLKRRRREEWGDNVAVSADRRAAELLAELFPSDAKADTAET